MSLLDDPKFADHFSQFLEHGWPHLSAMLDTLAPQAVNMDHMTRTVLFNFLGQYFHLTARNAEGMTIAEAHAAAIAEVMEDGAVNQLVQTQLKSMLDQGVKRFQEDHQ